MKTMKKMMVLVLSIMMVLGTSVVSAFAASIEIESTADEALTETTVYNYYKILDADIEDKDAITVDPDTGESTSTDAKVVYYVTTQARATAIEGTNLFNVVKDATQNKWYVELKDKDNTSAEDIAAAFDEIKAGFETGSFAQTTPGGTAKKEGLDPGYYLITSTLGDKLAVQTLADISIKTKNSYPTVDKTIPTTDQSAQIGDEITYTITIEVPESANDQIVLTDSMTEGLTYKAIESVSNGTEAVQYTMNAAEHGFTMTFAKDKVVANKGKTITVTYKAVLNKDAVVDEADDDEGNDNTAKINYGQHYESKPVTVETDTQKFTFDKVDGTDQTKLPGAKFELRRDGTALPLVEVTAGEAYRVAEADETGTVTEITTTGKVITISGVDGDITYQLVETKAPTGYELPANPSTDVKANTANTLEVTIENNKGSELPSTGGMGTTILYIVGGMLVVGCGIMLVAKKKADK